MNLNKKKDDVIMVNYIVFDLEATCEDKEILQKKRRTFENEMIEIGAVKVNEKGEIIDTFNRFVKPILNPVLTEFCKSLTSISQSDIDNAKSFPEVIKEFRDWIGEEDYVLCSWGFYDKSQLKHDCALHRIPDKWISNHISIKHQYQTIKGLSRAVGTWKALRMEGMTFEGVHHRGIDDAKNIAKIFIKYLNKWEIHHN